jgi:RNA-directed DNA polymerase
MPCAGRRSYYLLILQRHSKAEAEEVAARVKDYLQTHLHLEQNEEKTRITHPTEIVPFLGYALRSKGGRRKNLSLTIPKEAQIKLLRKVEQLCRLHYIAETDLFLKVNALVRGWMNYYRYASAPQRTFSAVLAKVVWQVSHYLAGKHRTSIPRIFKRYAATVHKNGRTRRTLRKQGQGKAIELWMFPPQTQSIYAVGRGTPEIDCAPQTRHEWASGHSIERRIEVLEAGNYRCQACGTADNLIVHHRGGLPDRRRTKPREAAGRAKQGVVLCQRCHLQVGHGGSFAPRHRDRKIA